MKIALMLGAGVLGVLLLFLVIGIVVGPQPAKAARETAVNADPQQGGGFDLHGLARVPLPKAFRFRGLDVYNGHLSPAEQLAQHDDPHGLVFRFDAHARNDWGGHARDPMLLNVVLMNPANPAANAQRRFSIGRYYSPTGDTIPLDDPRWNEQRQTTAAGVERVWRWLEMNDHFGTDEAPRWAVTVYEPARALRLDFYVWRRKMSLDQARAFLTRTLDTLVVHAARDAHFQRPGTQEERMAAMRQSRIDQFFATLAPLGVVRPAPGGTSFGADTAAWLDGDLKSLRAMRVLAQVPLPSAVQRDGQGRPQLPLAPADPSAGPRPLPLRMLYWHADSGSWRYTRLVRPTAHDDWLVMDFESQVVARLADRGSVYIVYVTHAYRPPALDDAPEAAAGFLAEAERWRGELLAGHILALPAQPVRLVAAAR